MANTVNVRVTSNAIIASTSASSVIKIAKLEDNIGNLDKGEDGVIATGETLVYNATSEKWEAVSLQSKVATAVSEALNAGSVPLDGGTF